MHIQTVLELSMLLDTERFNNVLSKAYIGEGSDNDEYTDHSLASKGVTVVYRDSQYKKKVKLVVKPDVVLDSDKPNSDKLVRKLEKRIGQYFDSVFSIDDFMLAGMVMSTDIDVRDREKVSAYIKVLQRIGKVKGFSPPSESWIDGDISFSLDGNSNGINFMILDLERLLRDQMKRTNDDHDRKQLKAIAKKAEGIIHAEVRLSETKAIHAYTDETDTSGQIAALSEKMEKVFLDTFMKIIPFGDFFKLDKAKEMIRDKVSDKRMRRRCIRLLELVPEKKSLLLAQKALNYRRVDEVMAAFFAADVAPVTISKRHDIKKLDNLYKYI